MADQFQSVEVLGLARSASDLVGDYPADIKKLDNIHITELVFPGDYGIQALLCVITSWILLPWPGLLTSRRWVKARDKKGTIFFFEGFPLASWLSWLKVSDVYWGTVDSYLLRFHRLYRFGYLSKIRGYITLSLARQVERIAIKRAKRIHMYSEHDACIFRRFHHVVHVQAIPIAEQVRSFSLQNTVNEQIKILVWADASYPYLEKSIRTVFDLVKSWKTETKAKYIFLIGNNEELKKEVSQAGWNVYTRVNDLDELVSSVDFVLIPDLCGTGIKNRTIYAVACGACVIGTRFAWEGIPMQNEINGILIKDLAQLREVVKSFAFTNKYQMIRANSHALLESFSLKTVSSKWQQFFGMSQNSL